MDHHILTHVTPADFHQVCTVCTRLVTESRYHAVLALLCVHRQRILDYFLLPPHYQRRMMLDALGVMNLAHLPHMPPLSPPFPIHVPLLPDLPADSVFSKRMHDRPDEFYRLIRLTLTEFLVIYYELQHLIRTPRRLLVTVLEIAHITTVDKSHRKLHPADELLLFLHASDGNHASVLCYHACSTFIAHMLETSSIMSQRQLTQCTTTRLSGPVRRRDKKHTGCSVHIIKLLVASTAHTAEWMCPAIR